MASGGRRGEAWEESGRGVDEVSTKCEKEMSEEEKMKEKDGGRKRSE